MAYDLPAAFRALAEIDRRDPEYSTVFAQSLDVTGASISTLGTLLGSETLSASDASAARLDELQFDLGEGPCWDAMNTGKPVLVPDANSRLAKRWPAFFAELESDIGGVFAFPLVLGPLKIGAVDMYSTEPSTFDDARAEAASAMAAVVSRHVLRSALDEAGDEYSDESHGRHSRRVIHQASGVVFAQLSISVDDALLVLEGHAFATGSPLMAVANDVVAGRLVFTNNGTIEDRHEG